MNRFYNNFIVLCATLVLQLALVIFGHQHIAIAGEVLIKPDFVLSNSQHLFGFTKSGDQLSKILIDGADIYGPGRDLIALEDGRVAIVNKVAFSAPKLSIYDAVNNEWTHLTSPDWGIASNGQNGGIAANGNFVYVTDNHTGLNGIIRFNLSNNSSSRFLSNGYIDVTMGLDGYLYALRHTGGELDKVDINTMTIVDSIDLELTAATAVTADFNGNLYMADGDGVLSKYDSDLVLVNSIQTNLRLYDIDIDSNNEIVMTDRDHNINITNTSLTNLTSLRLNLGQNFDVAFIAFSNASTLLPTPDFDDDGIADYIDNCPTQKNPDQEDENSNGIGDVCDIDVLDFMPPIIAAINGKTLPPEWGVFNQVCCPSSSATFSATIETDTLSSSLASCSATPTFQGFKVSTEGPKNFSSVLSSSSCGNIPIDFAFTFEDEKRYLFQMELENGSPAVFVYSEDIESLRTSATSGSYMSVIAKNTMTLEKAIELNLVEGLKLESQTRPTDGWRKVGQSNVR